MARALMTQKGVADFAAGPAARGQGHGLTRGEAGKGFDEAERARVGARLRAFIRVR